MRERVAFSSARKWSAASFAERPTVVLGAPEVLLETVEQATAERVRASVEPLTAAAKRVLLVVPVTLATQVQLVRVLQRAAMVALLQLTGQVERVQVVHQETLAHQDRLVQEQLRALRVERLLRHGLVKMALLVIQVRLLRRSASTLPSQCLQQLARAAGCRLH